MLIFRVECSVPSKLEDYSPIWWSQVSAVNHRSACRQSTQSSTILYSKYARPYMYMYVYFCFLLQQGKTNLRLPCFLSGDHRLVLTVTSASVRSQMLFLASLFIYMYVHVVCFPPCSVACCRWCSTASIKCATNST